MNLPTEDPIEFAIPAFPIEQPIGEFYVGVMSSKRLQAITWFDVRRIEKEREVETYLGIQRPLRPKRVKEIAEYVTTIDACFPTSVLIAVPSVCVRFDPATREMTLSNHLDAPDSEKINYRKIAKVLDGQHRIVGLGGYNGDDFEINVSIFVDADIAEQAYIFSVVNLAQTKVSKSLVYDLYDLAKSRSPQKLCHNIAVALDRHEDSPFFHRVKRLGSATEGRFSETLTQATFVQSLMRYISRKEMQDRDIYKRGRIPERASPAEVSELIFRNMMIEEKDAEIADVVWNFFEAVEARWDIAWNNLEPGNVLSRTNGFRGLMRFLRDAYIEIAAPGEVPDSTKFLEILEKSDLKDEDFNVDNYPPGSSGESRLHADLRSTTGLSLED